MKLTIVTSLITSLIISTLLVLFKLFIYPITWELALSPSFLWFVMIFVYSIINSHFYNDDNEFFHALISSWIMVIITALLTLTWWVTPFVLFVSTGITLSLGFIKEIYMCEKYMVFDFKNLIANMIGILVAIIVILSESVIIEF